MTKTNLQAFQNLDTDSFFEVASKFYDYEGTTLVDFIKENTLEGAKSMSIEHLHEALMDTLDMVAPYLYPEPF